MNWTEILTILLPLLGLMSWTYARIEKKAEDREKKAEERFNQLREELKEIRNDLKSIDRRLTHLEARFQERGYWESRLDIEYRATKEDPKKPTSLSS